MIPRQSADLRLITLVPFERVLDLRVEHSNESDNLDDDELVRAQMIRLRSGRPRQALLA